jgi:hypothetical protein
VGHLSIPRTETQPEAVTSSQDLVLRNSELFLGSGAAAVPDPGGLQGHAGLSSAVPRT